MIDVILAGADLNNLNRGGQALAWGGIEFLSRELKDDLRIYFLKIDDHKDDLPEIHFVGSNKIILESEYFNKYDVLKAFIECRFLNKIGIPPRNKLAKILANSSFLFNISGGDSFSDIYGFRQYLNFAIPSLIALLCKVKLVILPQTIGPFRSRVIRLLSNYILDRSEIVYVRDAEYINQLEKMKIQYKEAYDLSCYMMPQRIDNIDIEPNSIGINISGLTYFNNYNGLVGKFHAYKDLIRQIVEYYLSIDKHVYLVPHTYNLKNPLSDDDLLAIIDLCSVIGYADKLHIIDKEYNAPQLKYIISQMEFFIGTRMHSCFAALFSNVPAFGLSYSYKFIGSFRKFGVNDCCYDINDLKRNDIPLVIKKIINIYDQRFLILKKINSINNDLGYNV